MTTIMEMFGHIASEDHYRGVGFEDLEVLSGQPDGNRAVTE